MSSSSRLELLWKLLQNPHSGELEHIFRVHISLGLTSISYFNKADDEKTSQIMESLGLTSSEYIEFCSVDELKCISETLKPIPQRMFNHVNGETSSENFMLSVSEVDVKLWKLITDFKSGMDNIIII